MDLPDDDMGIDMPEEDEGISLNEIIGASRLRPRDKAKARSRTPDAAHCCCKNCLRDLQGDRIFQVAHAKFQQMFADMSGPEQNHKLFHMLRDTDLQCGVGGLAAGRSAMSCIRADSVFWLA